MHIDPDCKQAGGREGWLGTNALIVDTASCNRPDAQNIATKGMIRSRSEVRTEEGGRKVNRS